MNALRDFAVFLVELLGEIRCRIRHVSARGVCAWLTEGSGIRLVVLVGSIAYLWAWFGPA